MLARNLEEQYRLSVDLDVPLNNFIPSHDPSYQKQGCHVEGFSFEPRFAWRLIIFLLIVGLIIYLLQQKEE